MTQLYKQGADVKRIGQYVKELLACRCRLACRFWLTRKLRAVTNISRRRCHRRISHWRRTRRSCWRRHIRISHWRRTRRSRRRRHIRISHWRSTRRSCWRRHIRISRRRCTRRSCWRRHIRISPLSFNCCSLKGYNSQTNY